jgi:hypothetical protein
VSTGVQAVGWYSPSNSLLSREDTYQHAGPTAAGLEMPLPCMTAGMLVLLRAMQCLQSFCCWIKFHSPVAWQFHCSW